MILTKWVFDDGVNPPYRMVRNPREMTSVAVPQQTTSWPALGRGRLAFRTGRRPVPWEFSGVVSTQEDYDALLAWSKHGTAFQITDHLGRVHEVIPVSFEPKPRRSRKEKNWRFDYTFKALYVRRIA